MRRAAALITVAAALGVSTAVTAAASKPTTTTGSSSSVTNNAATINGTVNPNGQPTAYAFQYGTSTSYGQQTAAASAGSGTTAKSVSASLSNLTPGTTYHYRLIATNTSGTSTGADASFKTGGLPPSAVVPPTVKTSPATGVKAHAATINGTVNPNGSPVKVYFEYGLTKVYGVQTPSKSVSAGTSNVSVKSTLSGLQSNQTYHYRLDAQDANGHTFVGGDKTFHTAAAVQAPLITNLAINPNAFHASNGATISYRDSQKATTTVVIERIANGVKQGGHCVAPKSGSSGAARCTRFIRVLTFQHNDKAGANPFHLNAASLAKGRYRLTVQAHNGHGTSPRKRVRFRVT